MRGCHPRMSVRADHERASDPSKQFIVYVFLVSPSGNSVGIWRRKLSIPEELRNEYAGELAQVNAYVSKKPHIVAVEK